MNELEMNKLELIRKNIVANTIERFHFGIKGFEFLVKNFNDFDIYVAFKSTNDTDEMIKIPAKCAQVCIRNKSNAPDNSSKDVYVYAESNGEVEVQCLRF